MIFSDHFETAPEFGWYNTPYFGSFPDFRRFLTRGKKKVEAEWLLLSLAINILKLHFKIQKGRLGTALKVPESFPKGL